MLNTSGIPSENILFLLFKSCLFEWWMLLRFYWGTLKLQLPVNPREWFYEIYPVIDITFSCENLLFHDDFRWQEAGGLNSLIKECCASLSKLCHLWLVFTTESIHRLINEGTEYHLIERLIGQLLYEVQLLNTSTLEPRLVVVVVVHWRWYCGIYPVILITFS